MVDTRKNVSVLYPWPSERKKKARLEAEAEANVVSNKLHAPRPFAWGEANQTKDGGLIGAVADGSIPPNRAA